MTKQLLPAGGNRQQQRVEESQQCETRHGLHDTRKTEHRPTDPGVAAREHYERQTDEKTQRQRGGAEQNMLAQVIRQQARCRGETFTHARLVPA